MLSQQLPAQSLCGDFDFAATLAMRPTKRPKTQDIQVIDLIDDDAEHMCIGAGVLTGTTQEATGQRLPPSHHGLRSSKSVNGYLAKTMGWPGISLPKSLDKQAAQALAAISKPTVPRGSSKVAQVSKAATGSHQANQTQTQMFVSLNSQSGSKNVDIGGTNTSSIGKSLLTLHTPHQPAAAPGVTAAPTSIDSLRRSVGGFRAAIMAALPRVPSASCRWGRKSASVPRWHINGHMICPIGGNSHWDTQFTVMFLNAGKRTADEDTDGDD